MHSSKLTHFLLEIDKIATNTAFNDVKVLDGSYDTDIRAGNTNPENIQVAVTAQTTSALGGVAMSSTPATAKATGTRTDNGDGTSTSTLKVKAAD